MRVMLSELPQSIGGLSSLEALQVNDNDLKALPSTIGSLSKLSRLVAYRCALSGMIYFQCFCMSSCRSRSHARVFIGMPAMSGCTALTSIDLDFNTLTAAGLEPFCSNPPPNLTKLEVASCGLQGACI
jgi:Leucine-rich repeat (LRR) protein